MAVPGTEVIIFDCFGVLYVDSKVSLLSVVPAHKHEALEDIFKGNNYGLFGRGEYLKQVADVTGLSVDEVSSYMAKEHTLNHQLITLITDELKPHYKIGMLSNIGREWIDDFFTKHQLHDLFDDVVLSGEEGMVKPNVEIFQLAAARLGVAEESCLMIDDIKENCEGAEMAGMSAVHFLNNQQLLDELYARALCAKN